MKDEIPQSVIDSHVKNAAKARAEKAKKENSEESKGRVKNECEWNKQAAFKFVNQTLVCEQALWGALATGREKEGDLATTSLEFEFHLQIPSGSSSTSASVNKHWKTRAKSNYVIINVISANQHFASTFSMQLFKFHRRSCMLFFRFPLRRS